MFTLNYMTVKVSSTDRQKTPASHILLLMHVFFFFFLFNINKYQVNKYLKLIKSVVQCGGVDELLIT